MHLRTLIKGHTFSIQNGEDFSFIFFGVKNYTCCVFQMHILIYTKILLG